MLESAQLPLFPIGGNQTQELLAPVQDTLIAKQNYTQGQQFILGGALFTVIKSGGISEGDTINMNTDVEASEKITDQILSMKGSIIKVINKNFGSVTFNAGGEVAVTPPTTPSGYTFLLAIPFSYSGIPSGAISFMANYLQGVPNKTISVIVRYVYVRSENIETSTV